MAKFSWTEYHFVPSGEPLSAEAYIALRDTMPSDREAIVARMRAERKLAFKSDHNAEFIMLYIFLAGIPLLIIPPVGGLIIFFLFVPVMSLWNSAYSHNKALNARCDYLRREFAAAMHSASYSEYLRVRRIC